MKLTALTPIRHNGKRVAVGDEFDAEKKTAAALIAAGHAEEAPKATPAAPTQPAGVQPQQQELTQP